MSTLFVVFIEGVERVVPVVPHDLTNFVQKGKRSTLQPSPLRALLFNHLHRIVYESLEKTNHGVGTAGEARAVGELCSVGIWVDRNGDSEDAAFFVIEMLLNCQPTRMVLERLDSLR